jgi:hypothetical protein
MTEYLVGVADGNGTAIFEESFEDGIDALDYASNADTWYLPTLTAGFVTVWADAQCLHTFYSQEQAADAYNVAVGRG